MAKRDFVIIAAIFMVIGIFLGCAVSAGLFAKNCRFVGVFVIDGKTYECWVKP